MLVRASWNVALPEPGALSPGGVRLSMNERKARPRCHSELSVLFPLRGRLPPTNQRGVPRARVPTRPTALPLLQWDCALCGACDQVLHRARAASPPFSPPPWCVGGTLHALASILWMRRPRPSLRSRALLLPSCWDATLRLCVRVDGSAAEGAGCWRWRRRWRSA